MPNKNKIVGVNNRKPTRGRMTYTQVIYKEPKDQQEGRKPINTIKHKNL
jgi:hypothetical protein